MPTQNFRRLRRALMRDPTPATQRTPENEECVGAVQAICIDLCVKAARSRMKMSGYDGYGEIQRDIAGYNRYKEIFSDIFRYNWIAQTICPDRTSLSPSLNSLPFR